METIDVVETADFQRAYTIHGQAYEGEAVTADEQAFFDAYVRELAEKVLASEGRNVGLTLWLMFALKYVTPSEA